MVTVFLPLRTSATFSIGTRTSLIYSPISSVLRRFSMLSLTFCSWPARVWMTNHWLCMQSSFCQLAKFSTQDQSDQLLHNKIDAHREGTQERQGDHDHHPWNLSIPRRTARCIFSALRASRRHRSKRAQGNPCAIKR